MEMISGIPGLLLFRKSAKTAHPALFALAIPARSKVLSLFRKNGPCTGPESCGRVFRNGEV
ncbi:MAG: hypothetical protein EBX52_05810 [Proteobacteria bacterium]|nr:hypothetical protein [Pseudomonadota bacterium]